MQPLGPLAVVKSTEPRSELQAWLTKVQQPILDHATETDYLVGIHLGTSPGDTLHIDRNHPGQVTFEVSISGPPPDAVLLSDPSTEGEAGTLGRSQRRIRRR
jgi:hypothetical protein